MRARRYERGYTLPEFLIATAIATMLGGVVAACTMNLSQLFSSQATLHELSGYLDATTEQLKRDLWGAVAACRATTPCPDPTPGVASWLGLDMPPLGWGAVGGAGDISYRIDAITNPNDVRLVRTQNGATRILVHYVDTTQTPQPTISGSLITFSIRTKKTVSGKDYKRSIAKVAYALQTP